MKRVLQKSTLVECLSLSVLPLLLGKRCDVHFYGYGNAAIETCISKLSIFRTHTNHAEVGEDLYIQSETSQYIAAIRPRVKTYAEVWVFQNSNVRGIPGIV
jgi:hypothetical protein